MKNYILLLIVFIFLFISSCSWIQNIFGTDNESLNEWYETEVLTDSVINNSIDSIKNLPIDSLNIDSIMNSYNDWNDSL